MLRRGDAYGRASLFEPLFASFLKPVRPRVFALLGNGILSSVVPRLNMPLLQVLCLRIHSYITSPADELQIVPTSWILA